MVSIALQASGEERERLIAELWDAGTSGITEEGSALRAFFETPDAVSLCGRFAEYRPVARNEEERDWVREAQAQWEPFAVGERFYLVPEWRDDAAPCGRVRLWMNGGLASGSGLHPCTQLCLRALERCVSEGDDVLDVGTGSGILAHAAKLLGANRVAGCDIDPDAAPVAHEHAARYPYRPGFFTGSLRSVKSEAFDLVVANIHAPGLGELARDLARITRPGGKNILSGFRSEETPGVENQLGRAAQDRIEQEGWMCLIL